MNSTKLNSNSGGGRRKPSKRDHYRLSDDIEVARRLDAVSDPAVPTRRILVLVGDLSTNGSGYIPAASAFSSSNAFSAPDFASLATLFVSYRVLMMEVTFQPVVVVNTTTNVEVGCFVSCEWNAGTSPSTYQSVCEGANMKVRNGRKIVKICAKNTQLQNQQFTSITAPVTGSDSFGIAYGAPQTGRPATATTQWSRYTQRMLCEFKYAG
jgi:hypothetical protein